MVTVMKFIHGWLATMKKRSIIGEVATPLCMLCREEENNLHIYSCKFETIREARDKEWRKLDEVGRIFLLQKLGLHSRWE